ncbi:DUF305 domain-containing protein [Natronorubrum sp. FCH18a]|uniref:DUF305 domain-containing protein n=1 Tax=Natronorubrum sp. FCH18a TaxID=3447018 RepID=UPI003F5100B7
MTRTADSNEPDDQSRRTLLKTGALASSGLALGLGGAVSGAADEPVAHDEDGNPLNLADVTFLQLMAYHHRGGIELAELVPERTDHDQLREMARMAIEMQTQEIEEIEGILADAGIEPGRVLRADLDDVRGFVTAIPGQPEVNELAYLESLEGRQFDLRFIERFTYHHSGAIQLSQRLLREGQSPVVAELAEGIIEMQLEEIVQLYGWYLEWV